MEFTTSILCDTYTDMVDVAEPMLSTYGGIDSFFGSIRTVKCFEHSGLISSIVEEDGSGRVLLIDGGGSLRRALVDAEIAETAAANNWEGIICYGAVRDVDDLEEIDIGIQALASIPVGADNDDTGEIDVAVNFAGVTFLPEDYVYADTTGVVLSPEPLTLDDNEFEEA
ncbi:ribonuclease E activity regulator RraA [Catenovulum adriaticum]|uniref:Regulator of ribonuclease activity A n=1 Tax=Catenovulum adriaticum TaxID=2984846 RepID=A0ABY7AM18_9ALTE|nr:ribonuclease E activity regulator RraA [Catenovulum sp. TS8]WAJ69505.1 ribonuclease E activity regulator RraA [Catenovulum sp. TS8]